MPATVWKVCADHFFHGVHDAGFVNEGHFDVELGEFGLAVGAEVFVAKAADDLVVAFEAGGDEHLFEELGGLRRA